MITNPGTYFTNLKNKHWPRFIQSRLIISCIMWSIHWVLGWSQGPGRCYADILLTQATHLSDVQLEQSLWEPIIESADTTLVTTEWIMFELARNPAIQERLYKEVVDVTGGHGYETTRMVTEDDIPSMPYLSAVIKETLRKYPPVPLLPSRYVEKDTTLGGYDIPKGWQVGDTLQSFKFQKIPVQSSKCNVRCKTSRWGASEVPSNLFSKWSAKTYKLQLNENK